MKKRKGRMLSGLLTLLLLLLLLPFTAMQAGAAVNTVNIADGYIDVWLSTATYSVDIGGTLQYSNVSYTDSLLITGSTSTYIVTIRDVSGGTNVSVKITLDNLSIDKSGQTNGCAFLLESGTQVELSLTGSNSLKSGANRAGLEVRPGAKLTVAAPDDSHSLTAEGGASGAGIGSDSGQNGGDITIKGGVITAKGGDRGAGIGGGCRVAGIGGAGGTIRIEGGIVEAVGGGYAAGIGGGGTNSGGAGDSGDITITGGTITAEGSNCSAGIGGGRNSGAGTISISGGGVTATGGAESSTVNGGAGIGSGASGNVGGTVTINGGTVKATGQAGGMDIGQGASHTGTVSVQISGGSVYPVNGAAAVSSPTSDGATPVYLNTLTLSGGSGNIGGGIAVTSLLPKAYGATDVFTLDGGRLYFWLPETTSDETVAATAGGTVYGARWTRGAAAETKTLPPYTLSIVDGNVTIMQGAAEYAVFVGMETVGTYPYTKAYAI